MFYLRESKLTEYWAIFYLRLTNYTYFNSNHHKKRKDCFLLAWLYRTYIKTAKNDDIWEELLSENDFKAVLAIFCCYDHGAKSSEEVRKIATH